MGEIGEYQGEICAPIFLVKLPVFTNSMPVRLVANFVGSGFPSPVGDDLEDEVLPFLGLCCTRRRMTL